MTGLNFRTSIIIVAFIAIISFPLINKKLKIVKDTDSSENRQMSAEPTFDIKLLDPFPSKYEKFYTDNFTIRSIMVKYYNLLNLEFFEISPIPDQVLIGKDGWLFMEGNEMDSYRGKNRLKKSEMEALKLELEYRTKYLSERGCKFYFVIAPSKANIYPEKIPDNIYQIYNQCWSEQLNEYLATTNTVNFISAYKTLMNNKSKELLYHKLDNHWNNLGAFFVANNILKQIKLDIPIIDTTNISDYSITSKEVSKGNIVDMLANSSGFKEGVLYLNPLGGFQAKDSARFGYQAPKSFPYPDEYELVKIIENSKKPKLLIISDSFGNAVFPFLAESFSRTVRIFDGWQYQLHEDIIESEKPDVVLLILLESNVRGMLNAQSRLKELPKIETEN
jgi:alginate O-acetyltransferase complex protein AlgJ